MVSMTVFCPAKINLFLGIEGKRSDHYHELLTLMAPVNWGDVIEWRLLDKNTPDEFIVEGDEAYGPLEENTVWRALKLFRKHCEFNEGVSIVLKKNIPVEAGLGGGSSDAGCFLKSLNTAFNNYLTNVELQRIAIAIGSDVPFFLQNEAVIASGRGEILEPISDELKNWLKNQRWCIFKPLFGMSTIWAYDYLKKYALYRGGVLKKDYLEWQQNLLNGQVSFENDFLSPVSFRYPIIKLILDELKEVGFCCGLSGSGTACFLLNNDPDDDVKICKTLDCWLGKGQYVFKV